MQMFCQWAEVASTVFAFFVCVNQCFNGRKAKEPDGFFGFCITLVLIALIAANKYGAGAFSLILPS